MLARLDADVFPVGGGELGALIRKFDWSRTPLGPIRTWPQSLKTAVDVVLQSPVPLVMLWGGDGIMIYNDAYSVFAGGRHPQLLGSKVLEGWPEVADLNRRVMEVGLRGETLSFRDEHLVLFRPGRPPDVWLNLDYSPLLDESGVPAGVLAIVVETTDRVRAEQALRESEAQFRTFASAMPHHVWAANPDGKLDWVNDKVLEYTGANTAGLQGDRWGEVVHPQDRALAVEAWQKALATSTVYEVEFRLRRNDGVFRWYLARAMPIRDDAGKVVRWIGTNTDIDDRIQAERALRERQAELARVQQIGKVGGVEVLLSNGFRNRRSPDISPFTACLRKPPRRRTRTGYVAFIRRTASKPSGSSSMRWRAMSASTPPSTASCAPATGNCAGSPSRPRSSTMRRAAPGGWWARTSM